MSACMDARELASWIAFFNLHGYPDMRQEFYGAQIASLMLQVVSSKGKKYKTTDFLLDEILESKAEREDRALRQHLEYLVVATNGK